MKTRKQLMQELNELLGTDHNWRRLNKFDLMELVNAVKKLIGENNE